MGKVPRFVPGGGPGPSSAVLVCFLVAMTKRTSNNVEEESLFAAQEVMQNITAEGCGGAQDRAIRKQRELLLTGDKI